MNPNNGHDILFKNHEEVSIIEKFIPYEKLSKKQKRKTDLAKRQTWGELNPVTRRPENRKVYKRNKARNWKRVYHEPIPGILCQYLLRLLPGKLLPVCEFLRDSLRTGSIHRTENPRHPAIHRIPVRQSASWT